MIRRPPRSTLFPTRRSSDLLGRLSRHRGVRVNGRDRKMPVDEPNRVGLGGDEALQHGPRSEEHTSELQSLTNLVCRLLLEKKKKHHPKKSQLQQSVVKQKEC